MMGKRNTTAAARMTSPQPPWGVGIDAGYGRGREQVADRVSSWQETQLCFGRAFSSRPDLAKLSQGGACCEGMPRWSIPSAQAREIDIMSERSGSEVTDPGTEPDPSTSTPGPLPHGADAAGAQGGQEIKEVEITLEPLSAWELPERVIEGLGSFAGPLPCDE